MNDRKSMLLLLQVLMKLMNAQARQRQPAPAPAKSDVEREIGNCE
jgi:hypothetical protein